MARYAHACPTHGEFEVRCSMHATEPTWPCPECGEPSGKLIVIGAAQFHLPGHFRTTLPTTGLTGNTGGSGEFENLKADFNRWDSGAQGIQDPADKARRKEAAKKLVATPTGVYGGSR